jgi:hypothetical protein
MGQAALENWDFQALIDDGKSPEWVEAYKEALDFGGDPVNYAKNTFAEDDGLIYLNKAYNNWWDKLEEFATNAADNALN